MVKLRVSVAAEWRMVSPKKVDGDNYMPMKYYSHSVPGHCIPVIKQTIGKWQQ